MLLKNSLLYAFVINLLGFSSTTSQKVDMTNIASTHNKTIHRYFFNTERITTIQFNKSAHDFGVINPKNTYNTFFKVTNTGKYPLIIEKVDASCGCTKVNISKKIILSGTSARIDVSFHPFKNEKSFQKVIAIVANTQPRISLLTIQGKTINN